MLRAGDAKLAHIDYYFSTMSPFTYLAGTTLEQIAARHGATITYKPLDIVALFARTGGVAPADRHPSRQSYRAQEILRQARKREIANGRTNFDDLPDIGDFEEFDDLE